MTETLSPTFETDFSAAARDLVKGYLERVRRALVESGTAEDTEIERDIVEHIEAALAESPRPVTPTAVEVVLDQLGSPRQWIPESDAPPGWRHALGRLSAGARDWRLAWLCFGAFLAALAATPLIGPLGLVVSYLVTRAAVSVSAERGDLLGARRWLFYPPLLIVVLPLLAGALVWVVFPLAALAKVDDIIEPAARARAILLVFAGLATWWLVLSQLAGRALPAVRWLLLPVADRLEPRHVHLLSWVALALAVMCVATWFFLRGST